MLLRIKIKNFRSFYEETEFDMFPNPKRTSFPNHVYSDQKIPLLKQAVFYGANGSGKSNFIEAINFLKSFVVDKDFMKRMSVSRYVFRLIEKENLDPICFTLEFKALEEYFIYSVRLSDDSVEEELYASGLGEKENELIYQRVGSKITAPLSDHILELKEAIDNMVQNNPKSSLLSLNSEFPILKDKRVATVRNWFEKQLSVMKVNTTVPALIELMSANESLLNFTNEMFANIGVGIEAVKIKSEPLDQWTTEDYKEFKIMLQDEIATKLYTKFEPVVDRKNLFSISMENGIRVVKEMVFEQIGANGFHGNLEINNQSDGTIRLLTLIPALYDAIHNKKVVCIDEIDHSIHPTLMVAIMEYFSSVETNGQLVFTTHETCLLNQQKLMRPDEVWFTEKHNGATRLYSLNEFKEHNTLSIEKGYLQGRYGAIPFIGKLGE